MIIIAPDGTEVNCYIREVNGMIDAILRADTKEDWETAALEHNILTYVERPENPNFLRPVRGNNVDIIGSVVIEPGVYDEETGETITEPVMDNRYHVNLRIAEPALSALDDDGYPLWKKTVLVWMNYGVDDLQINKNEQGKKLSNITLIDPDTISTPQRIWF